MHDWSFQQQLGKGAPLVELGPFQFISPNNAAHVECEAEKTQTAFSKMYLSDKHSEHLERSKSILEKEGTVIVLICLGSIITAAT